MAKYTHENWVAARDSRDFAARRTAQLLSDGLLEAAQRYAAEYVRLDELAEVIAHDLDSDDA